MTRDQTRKATFVPQLHKRATISIRNKDENIVPDFMFNIETWSFQTVRARGNTTLQQINSYADSEEGPASIRLSCQALPSIPQRTALDVYTALLRSLMVPILDAKDSAEKILSINDASLLRIAFGISDADHQACVSDALNCLDKVSLIHFLENQKENIHQMAQEDFQSAEQYQTWKQEAEQEIDDKIAKLKTEPHFQAKVIVDVLDATDLVAKDMISHSSDPYVVLKLKTANERKSKDKEKTKVIHKELNPVWHERFTFQLKAENSRIKLEVWDDDLPSPPDFIGQRTLITSFLTPFFTQTHTLPLGPKQKGLFKGKPKSDDKLGTLRVKTQYIVRRMPEKCGARDVLKSYAESLDMFKILVRMFVTERSPELSQDVAWMFNNFCTIYGIGRVTQKLVILEVLVSTFLPTRGHIISAKNCASECSKDIFGQRCIAKKSEVNLYYQVMGTLRVTLENLISKYTYAFPISGGRIVDDMTLGGTVTLFELTWNAAVDNNLRAKRGTFKETLISLIEKSMETNWEIWKHTEMMNLAMAVDSPGGAGSPVVVAPVTMQMMDDDSVTITLLYILCEHVFLQLSHDVEVYAREVPNDVHLAHRSLSFYYTKISGYVSDVFVTKKSPVSLTTFTIYGKLLELHKRFEPYMQNISKLDLQQVFRKYFDQWVSQAAHKLKNWAKSAIENETWEPIAKTEGSLHTSSVVDIFTSFTQSRQFLVLLGPELKTQYIPFTKVVGNVTEFYCSKLKELALQEIAVEMENVAFEKNFLQFLQQNAKSGRDRRSTAALTQNLKTLSLTASPKLCAVLNSLEVSRELLDEFTTEMEKIAKTDSANVAQSLKQTFTTLKTICDQVDDVLLTKMNRCISIIMGQMLENPPNPNEASDDEIENHLAFLFWYLDQELEILSSNLYEHVFLRILRQIYVTMLRDIEEIIFPEGTADSYKQEEQALFIEAVLKTHIHPFFFADGQGLTVAFLAKHSQQLLAALALFRTETSKLIPLYSTLPKNSLIFEHISAHQLLSVLASRKGDKKAQEFVDKKFSRSRSRTFKLKFNVQNNQIDSIASFSCLQQSPVFSFVQLFITNSLVCWSASLSNYRDVVPLTGICNIKMEDDFALSFVYGDPPQMFYFRSFARQEKLEQAYNTLVDQAKKVGNTSCTDENPNMVVNRLNINLQKRERGNTRDRANTKDRASSLTGSKDGLKGSKEGLKDKLTRKTSTDKLNELLLNNVHHPAVLRQQKEQKYRLFFALPDDEPISHSYICSLRVTSVGKMTIAQHFVCFRSKFPQTKIVIPISEVTVIEKKRSAVFNDAISIKTPHKSYYFSSFQRRDEVYLILTDLWDAMHHDSTKSPI